MNEQTPDPAALFSARSIVQQYIMEFILLNLLRSTRDPAAALEGMRTEVTARLQYRMRLEGDEIPGVDPSVIQAAAVKLATELFDSVAATMAASARGRTD